MYQDSRRGDTKAGQILICIGCATPARRQEANNNRHEHFAAETLCSGWSVEGSRSETVGLLNPSVQPSTPSSWGLIIRRKLHVNLNITSSSKGCPSMVFDCPSLQRSEAERCSYSYHVCNLEPVTYVEPCRVSAGNSTKWRIPFHCLLQLRD